MTTYNVTWAPEALEHARDQLIAIRDGEMSFWGEPHVRRALSNQSVMAAIDALRAVLAPPRTMIVVVEGVDTNDGRYIAPGATTWTGGSIPLLGLPESPWFVDYGVALGALVNLRRVHVATADVEIPSGDRFTDASLIVGDVALTGVDVKLPADWQAAADGGPGCRSDAGFSRIVFSHFELRAATVIEADQWAWAAKDPG